MNPLCRMPDCDREAFATLPWEGEGHELTLCEEHFLWLTGDTGLREIHVFHLEREARRGDLVPFMAGVRLGSVRTERRLTFTPQAWHILDRQLPPMPPGVQVIPPDPTVVAMLKEAQRQQAELLAGIGRIMHPDQYLIGGA